MNIRTSFRGKLLLVTIVPLAVAQLVTLIAVMRTVESDVDHRARESLVIGAAVVDEFVASRSEQLRTSVSVIAADFGLKEAVATADTETIRSALNNHIRRIGADIALLTDLGGQAITGTVDFDQAGFRKLTAPMANGELRPFRHFTENIDGEAYQVVAVPLRAPTAIAWVVVGFHIERRLADRLGALTGFDVAIVEAASAAVVESTGLPDQIVADAGSLVSAGPHDKGVFLVQGTDGGYLALGTPLIAGDPRLQVIMLRSMQEAMAPYTTARRWLLAFSAVLLLLVATAAGWVSGSIARPLGKLTNAVRQIIAGQYDASVNITSADEFGELASNFDAMRMAIAEREQRISHQALHNPLTDMPNRSKIMSEIAAAIENPKIGSAAVLSVRLSRMNEICSTLGHSASDELIKLAARHLRLNQDAEDSVAHVGTDEFVILLPDRNSDDAVANAERIRSILGAGVTLGRVNIALHTEIGIAVYPQHGPYAADLLRNSMIARSEAKTRGDSIAIYESGREEHFVRQLRIVNDLRSAIRKDQLTVHFQPKIALPSGDVCGAEALVRWQHPEYGWLPPDDFIPAAEEAGSIVHLTRFVLIRAIAECSRWQDTGCALQVSVNISAQDLQDEYLPHYVLEKLNEFGLPASRLTLEVTENTVMQKIDRAISVLQCLRDIGVRISMDDFGTGHSSLAQLRNIPLHELKIDKCFIVTLLEDSQNEAIVRTTLQLANSMDLDVVAEGIENEDTHRYLSGAGCRQAQGYYLSKPIPSDAFLTWLQEYEPVSYEERRGAGTRLRTMGNQA